MKPQIPYTGHGKPCRNNCGRKTQRRGGVCSVCRPVKKNLFPRKTGFDGGKVHNLADLSRSYRPSGTEPDDHF